MGPKVTPTVAVAMFVPPVLQSRHTEPESTVWEARKAAFGALRLLKPWVLPVAFTRDASAAAALESSGVLVVSEYEAAGAGSASGVIPDSIFEPPTARSMMSILEHTAPDAKFFAYMPNDVLLHRSFVASLHAIANGQQVGVVDKHAVAVLRHCRAGTGRGADLADMARGLLGGATPSATAAAGSGGDGFSAALRNACTQGSPAVHTSADGLVVSAGAVDWESAPRAATFAVGPEAALWVLSQALASGRDVVDITPSVAMLATYSSELASRLPAGALGGGTQKQRAAAHAAFGRSQPEEVAARRSTWYTAFAASASRGSAEFSNAAIAGNGRYEVILKPREESVGSEKADKLDQLLRERLDAAEGAQAQVSDRAWEKEGVVTMFLTLVGSPIDSQKYAIQLNTLRALSFLAPEVRTLVFAEEDDLVVRDMVRPLGIEIVSEFETSPYGMPYVRSMFQQAFLRSRTLFVGYTNADILYNSALIDTLRAVKAAVDVGILQQRVLITGRRTNTRVADDLRVGHPEMLQSPVTLDATIQAMAARGELFGPDAEDYFITTPGTFLWEEIPDFIVGRPGYDNWLVGYAGRKPSQMSLLDATRTVPAVHQTGPDGIFSGHKDHPEKNWNLDRGEGGFRDGWTTHAHWRTRWDPVAGSIGFERLGRNLRRGDRTVKIPKVSAPPPRPPDDDEGSSKDAADAAQEGAP